MAWFISICNIYIYIYHLILFILKMLQPPPPPQEICLLLEINIKHFFLGGGGVINVFELPKLLNAFFRSVKYINLVLASIYFRSLVFDLISVYWSLAWGGCQSWTETNGHFMGPCFSTRSMYKPFYTHRFSWNKETEKGRENCFINAENTTEKHAGPLLINQLLCAFVKF